MSAEERVVESLNYIKARGQIARIGRDGKGYGFIVLKMKTGAKQMNEATFSLAQPLSPDLVMGTTIDIVGHVRGAPLLKGDNGSPIIQQFYVADRITKSKSVLDEELGIPGTYMPSHYFLCFIKGAMVSYYENTKEWARIVVKAAAGNEESNYIGINYYKQGRLPKISKLVKGDEIALYTNTRFTKKVVKGEQRRYENLYVEDITIVSKGDGEEIPKLIDKSNI